MHNLYMAGNHCLFCLVVRILYFAYNCEQRVTLWRLKFEVGVMEDPSGRGLGGVLVSNGERIVQTDEEGPVRACGGTGGASRFVFVTRSRWFFGRYRDSTRPHVIGRTHRRGWIFCACACALSGLHDSLRLCRLPIHTL